MKFCFLVYSFWEQYPFWYHKFWWIELSHNSLVNNTYYPIIFAVICPLLFGDSSHCIVAQFSFILFLLLGLFIIFSLSGLITLFMFSFDIHTIFENEFAKKSINYVNDYLTLGGKSENGFSFYALQPSKLKGKCVPRWRNGIFDYVNNIPLFINLLVKTFLRLSYLFIAV